MLRTLQSIILKSRIRRCGHLVPAVTIARLDEYASLQQYRTGMVINVEAIRYRLSKEFIAAEWTQNLNLQMDTMKRYVRFTRSGSV